MSEKILEVSNLEKTYPNGTQALKGVSFDVEKGEFLVIIGLSGSGKSTLLRCINQLHRPTGGKIVFNGKDITQVDGESVRSLRQQIAMIFQHFNLVDRETVINNVCMGSLGKYGGVLDRWTRFVEPLVLAMIASLILSVMTFVRLDLSFSQPNSSGSSGDDAAISAWRAFYQWLEAPTSFFGKTFEWSLIDLNNNFFFYAAMVVLLILGWDFFQTAKYNAKAERQKAMKYLDLVGIGGKAQMRCDNLSGGQKQRVAIARALNQNPEVLLADEPVASLDPATCHVVMDYLQKVNRELGITVICNLHFLSLVRQYATRVIALKGGEIVYQGSPSRIDDAWFEKIYGENAKEVHVN